MAFIDCRGAGAVDDAGAHLVDNSHEGFSDEFKVAELIHAQDVRFGLDLPDITIFHSRPSLL